MCKNDHGRFQFYVHNSHNKICAEAILIYVFAVIFDCFVIGCCYFDDCQQEN